MKFIIAPDKYKGSLTGIEFCNAVEEGILNSMPNAEIVKIPLADGGDGTMDVLHYHFKGEKIQLQVKDPLFRPIHASYLFVEEKSLACIEMAEASGLHLLKNEEKNCLKTSTFGTGELINDALDKGAKTIILGIGGSATNDGGMGMAAALGFQFLDKNNVELLPTGENLINVAKIDNSNIHPLLASTNFQIACDVKNPLYGKNGAAHVYAAQKGASKEEIEFLDAGLISYSKIISLCYNIDVQEIKGSGAAGGLGAGSIVFLKGTLTSGIELIKQITSFDSVIQNSDWIITGEGKLDGQTLSGKTIQGVLTSAKIANIPVAAFCGSIEISIATQKKLGLAYACSITKGVTNLNDAIKDSYQNLTFSVFNFTELIKSL
jgi:glycerate 2-kinase